MSEPGDPHGPLIFLVAGEPSGDALGGRLMAALSEKTGGRVRFAGVGGEAMTAQGLQSLFPMAELSVMGLAEVLPHLPRLLRRIKQTANAAKSANPAVFISIDAPDFSFRVAKRLKGRNIPLVHYVAPSVWAWKPGRAKKIAAFLDHLLALLPFEPPYFEKEGLPCSFVGHAVLESGADHGDGPGFRSRHAIDDDAPLLLVLPGSRRGEISRLLPIYTETIRRLSRDRPNLKAVLPTLPHLAADVRAAVADWPIPVEVLVGGQEKYDAFAAADVALAASGTVGLELAMAGTPGVIAYKMHPVTAWLARRLVKVAYANIVNIVLNREAVPELLLEDCLPERLAPALAELLDDAEARARQKADMAQAIKALGGGEGTPSQRAAEVILEIIDKNQGKGRS